MRKISTSKGCRSFKSVDCGLRPSSSEISLPAPANFPLGEDQVISVILVVLTLFMVKSNALQLLGVVRCGLMKSQYPTAGSARPNRTPAAVLNGPPHAAPPLAVACPTAACET